MRDVKMEKGIAEREALRQTRKDNYKFKRNAGRVESADPKKRQSGFKCLKDGCEAREQVLVVELDGELTTRCQRHLEGDVRPGQWNAR